MVILITNIILILKYFNDIFCKKTKENETG